MRRQATGRDVPLKLAAEEDSRNQDPDACGNAQQRERIAGECPKDREEPELRKGDEQDRAESLDADKIDDDVRVEEDETVYPPDELQGADQYGITEAEERFEEPLLERVRREEPDPLVEELEGRGGRPHATDDGDADVPAEEAAMHVERER